MEHLQKELDSLLSQFPDETEIRNQLESLISVYPFNDYEYIISTLLGSGILTLGVYHRLREEYVTRNRYLEVFQISGTRTFGETWAHRHLERLAPELERPSKSLDPDYDQQYDFFLAGIRIEVKASRAVDAGSREPLYVKALSSGSQKNFRMNFQQIKPALCDVFVWIGFCLHKRSKRINTFPIHSIAVMWVRDSFTYEKPISQNSTNTRPSRLN